MPHYFFHVERNGDRIFDDEGCELSNLQCVEQAAVRAAADLAADDLKRGLQNIEQFIVVENGFGQDVVRVRVFALVQVQTARSA